jgi:hypothetical protein
MKNFLKAIFLFPFHVMMGVTTTDSTGGAAATPPYAGKDKYFVTPPITVTVPLTGVTNDVVKMIPVKAGWLVKGLIIKPVTAAAGTTITLDAGVTGGTTDGFRAAFDGKGTTTLVSPLSATYPAAGGFYVTADTTIDLLLKSISSMTTAPVFTVQAEIVVTT